MPCSELGTAVGAVDEDGVDECSELGTAAGAVGEDGVDVCLRCSELGIILIGEDGVNICLVCSKLGTAVGAVAYLQSHFFCLLCHLHFNKRLCFAGCWVVPFPFPLLEVILEPRAKYRFNMPISRFHMPDILLNPRGFSVAAPVIKLLSDCIHLNQEIC